MKSLRQFIQSRINEAETRDDVTLYDLTVKYDAPDEIYVQVPVKMGESDTQIYLDDIMLGKMPAQTSQDSFGKNASEIADSYFEYDNMEQSGGIQPRIDIEWDSHYNPSMNDEELVVIKIRGLKYVITFDKFELSGIDADNSDAIRETLYQLFNGVIGDGNKLPIVMTLNKDNITWK